MLRSYLKFRVLRLIIFKRNLLFLMVEVEERKFKRVNFPENMFIESVLPFRHFVGC